MSLLLIGGGSRSGKSRFALDLARARGRPLAFIATAGTLDEEMRKRAAMHRQERGEDFETFEEPLELSRLIREEGSRFQAIVVDCLTLWLSNLMFAGRDIQAETSDLLRIAAESQASMILVTNEVGCGIVPENELARRFRDEAGRMNQSAASVASEVYWTVFGIALRVK